VRTLYPIVLAIALSGCSWFSWGKKDSHPTLPPAASGKATPVDRYADAADEVMDIASAAVTVAAKRNDLGQPDTVRSELAVASAALPRPTPRAVREAESRAEAADAVIYAEAVLAADRLQRNLDTLWAAVEAEKEAARQALAAKQQELDAARAAQRDLIWTGAGLLITVLGLAAAVWGSSFGVTKVEASLVIFAGLGIGALPWALDSDLSAWVVAPVAGIVALRGIVYVWSLGWKK
jgi:hypothetical protein